VPSIDNPSISGCHPDQFIINPRLKELTGSRESTEVSYSVKNHLHRQRLCEKAFARSTTPRGTQNIEVGPV
jgi:hypothetical protein